eukprot:sb/3462931/
MIRHFCSSRLRAPLIRPLQSPSLTLRFFSLPKTEAPWSIGKKLRTYGMHYVILDCCTWASSIGTLFVLFSSGVKMETILSWAGTVIDVEYWRGLMGVQVDSLTGDKAAVSLAVVTSTILSPIRAVLNLVILVTLKRTGFVKFSAYRYSPPSPPPRMRCQSWILSRCPARLLNILTLWLLVLLILLAPYTISSGVIAPGNPVFSLISLLILSISVGWCCEKISCPPMLGMLLVGISLRNIPGVNTFLGDVPVALSSTVKNVSLMVILMKGGLSLDITEIRKVGFAVLRLAFVPCFVEAAVYAGLSVLILDLPWVWGFMLGFVMAAVTPAIIVPCLERIRGRGFEVDSNNIATMLISASSFDDVVAISAFMVCLSTALSTGRSLALQILIGPLELLVGVLLGGLLGTLQWVLPPGGGWLRLYLLLLLGLSAVFGMDMAGMGGSGPLSVIIMSLTAVKGWGDGGDATVSEMVDWLWWVGEPLLFGLVGRDIDLALITWGFLWRALLVISLSLVFRLAAALLSVTFTTLTLRERVFVAFSWIPKATVQAAIGSYALGQTVEGSQEREWAGTILTMAVIVILVSAPLGALLMVFTAPCLLDKKGQRVPDREGDSKPLGTGKADTRCDKKDEDQERNYKESESV